MAKRNLREEARLIRELNKEANDLLKTEGKLDSTYQNRLDLLQDIEDNLEDYNELKKKEKDLNAEINRLNSIGHTAIANKFDKEKQLTANAIKKLQTEKVSNSLLEAGDSLTGGMLGNAKGLMESFGGAGMKVGLMSAGLTAAVAILLSFSAKMDAIGKEFGAVGLQTDEIRVGLLGAEQEAARLGLEMSDVIEASTKLANDFGVGLTESIKLSSSVADTSVALGLSVGEGADLIGTFKSLVGLSNEQATALAKNVTLFAKSNDVAPQQVLRDIAGSSEAIAGFTSASGENIARAAVQARKFGISISDVASSAKSLLDFQNSYQNALEASVLVGKEINVEKLMELSLAGDLEALQQEQLKQLGSETEFNKLNVLQREALAEAVGLSLDQATKLVNKQDEAVTLAGQLAGQPGFDELVGTEGISTLTKMNNAFKSMGALLTNSLGPALNVVLVVLNGIVGLLDMLLEFSGINALLRFIGGQGFEIQGGAAVDRFTTGIGLADGGMVTGPTSAVVGEAGPEAVVPLDEFYRKFDSLKSEMTGVKEAIMSLQLTTKITNKDLNVILTPNKT